MELREIIENHCPLREEDDAPCKTREKMHCVYCESLLKALNQHYLEQGKGLTETIAHFMRENPPSSDHLMTGEIAKIASQLQAVIQPIFEAQKQEAVKNERERIEAGLKPLFGGIITSKDWDALKSGK